MLDENHLVEKSMQLVWAKFAGHGVGELKILDTYLSRIDARKPETARVVFTKKEYTELLGLSSDIKTSQLKRYTSKLMDNKITIDLPKKKGQDQYMQRSLFPTCDVLYDEDLKQTVIVIECHKDLRQAFFDIAEDRYITYQLKNTIALTSQYSIRLYTLLKAKPYGWTVSVEELRERLDVPPKKTYEEFKRVNDLIIKRAVAEINEITDLHVTTEIIRKGRAAVAVRFNAVSTHPIPEEEDFEMPPLPEEEDDPLDFFAEALPTELTREQVDLLRSEAMKHVPYAVASFHERDLWIFDYLRSKTLLMRAQGKPVHPNAYFSWLSKAVEQDWKQ